MLSVTLLSDAFVIVPIIYPCQRTMENIDLQMGMKMKAWQNPYNLAHEYSGWMIYQSSKAILECGCNKYRHSWYYGWKYPEMLMIKELSGIQIGNWIVKYFHFMFIALANLITTSWMHLYQIELSSHKEFQNFSIFLL